MSNQHIFQEMDHSMDNLREKVQLMASLTCQNIKHAIQALLSQDIDLARMVIGDDSEVDELEVKIDQLGLDILIRFHPVATDLRAVITAMKTAHNLERISDHAVNIAKRAKKICKSQTPIDAIIVEPLFIMADKILSDALRSYREGDSELGQGLHATDKELDAAYKQVSSSLSSRLENSGANAENILHLILVARSIERIGDLAVNIGEDSYFLSKARDIRHEQRKNQS
ncbi:MAG: phosphate signaling complex protein PhoU [Verrucomicrobiota bacterium]